MKMHLRVLIAAATTCAISTSQLAGQSFPTDAEVASILQERIAQGRGVGLIVGLLEADGSSRVVFAGSAGPDTRPLGERTVFEIGSITKVFTGALLAEMARREEVALTDPVSRHLPPNVRMPSRSGREITLLDLATHHSALPRLPNNMAPADPLNPYADYTVERMYAFLSGYELEREIGATFEYSNLAVGLLGHALGRAAGSSWEPALRERILDPLGMTNTGITLTGETAEWMARGHNQAGTVVPLWDLPTLAGAGALRADVNDMLRWLAANIGEPQNDLERSLRIAHEPRATLSEQGPVRLSIGLNWMIQTNGDSRIIWHNGGTGGFFSFLGFDPDRRVGVVVLANAQHSVDDIGMHLLDVSNPLSEPPRERGEIQVAPEVMQDYVGEYRLAPQFSIVVTLENGALFIQPTAQPRLPIFAESENSFFLRAVDAQITFQRDASGAVTGLILHQAGQNLPGTKER